MRRINLNKNTKSILDKLSKDGHSAFLVGGAVRDYILNRKTNDFDITTSRNVEEIIDVIKDGVVVNKNMGTVSYENFEITPYRIEGKYRDHRWPNEISFSRNYLDDISRRDFTINALLVNKDGELTDLTCGLSDIDNKIIKTIGNANDRFGEDALRMLRAIRFACELNFTIEESTFDAIVYNREMILELSEERIQDEFNKILLSSNVEYGLNLMRQTGVLDIVIPELVATYDFDQRNHHHKYDLYNHLLKTVKNTPKKLNLRLAALLHDIKKPDVQSISKDGCHYYDHEIESAKAAKIILKRLKYSNKIIDDVYRLIINHMRIDPNIGTKGVKRLLRDFNGDLDDFLALVRADSIATGNSCNKVIDKIEEMVDNIRGSVVLDSSVLAISGKDILQLGFEEGPIIGSILNEIMNLTELGFPNDRGQLLKLINNFLGGSMKKYFGTDGVRGIANSELTNEFAYNMSRAISELEGMKKVIIGYDTRLSSEMLFMSMASGFIASGVDVVNIGLISTPGVAYLTKNTDADIGIMKSASHNPYMYNGIKLIGGDGYKLPDDLEIVIENKIDNIGPESKIGDELGKLIDGSSLHTKYFDHIKSLTTGLEGFKIAVDPGNGVMSKIAPDIFKELGADVIAINADADGRYVNDNSGSTCPEKVAELTVKNSCDIGVSFDGDADRVIFSDSNGNVIDGDHIIAYAAVSLKKIGALKGDGVVTTSMSNGAFEEYLSKNDIKLFRANVGDKYVMEGLKDNNYILGGEKSGHIIFLDKSTMGDGLQTAVIIMEMLKKKNHPSTYISEQFKDYPQVLVNASASNELKKNYMDNERISNAINELLERHGNYRILIRASGTEKLVRIMIEGDDLKDIEFEANKIKDIIEGEN